MSPPGRTERGCYGYVIQGRITGNKHARCNMGTRSFIPWASSPARGRRCQLGQVR
jgi:hypothetical protein